MNDVAVSLYYAIFIGTNSTGAYYLTFFRVRLLKSKSVIALTRLNNISDKMFASNVSMFLGVPVTVKTNEKWTRLDDTAYIFDFKLGTPKNSDGSLFTSKYKRLLFNYCVVKYQSIHGC